MNVPAKNSLDSLVSFCRSQAWIGYDPYDALNSRGLRAVPLLMKNKTFRLLFLHLHKRSFINFRPFMGVPKGRNPKGTGLFLSGAVRLYRRSQDPTYEDLIREFVSWLKADASSGFHGHCWGYNFDWQSRAFFLPRGTPTVVCTSYIGRALLDAFDALGNRECLEIARSSCDFILSDLNRVEDQDSLCFSYSPMDRYFVHNATALASSLLSMTYRHTGENELARLAAKAMNHVVRHQRSDGTWAYGEDTVAQKTGTDNFHTGFILECLKIYSDGTGDVTFMPNLKKGLEAYQDMFFLSDWAPKYFPGRAYPLDIHSAAQAILTFLALKDVGADQSLCRKVLNWMIDNMQDKAGYFYYQKTRHLTNRIPYMRWSQAWAFLALSTYLLYDD